MKLGTVNSLNTPSYLQLTTQPVTTQKHRAVFILQLITTLRENSSICGTMSFYRNAVWFVKGLQEYTKSGYEAAAKHFSAGDLEVNLSGRSFMVTGANSGIGKATAQEIANRGGTVHMVCRNKDRAEAARNEIVEQSKNQNVHVHIVDMSSARQVWEFAQSFSQNNKIHVLINNAGCMVNQRELTDEGLEKNFATNTVGTYILTTALIPALKKAEGPRVVTVSSGGMLTQKLNVDDLQSEKGTFDGTMAYAQNKRQQVILTERWASLHKEIHFSSMHPGWADTPAVQSSMPSFHAKMQGKLRTEAMGADTVLWLAVSPAAAKQPSGLFFQDRKAVATHLPLASSRSTPQEEEKLLAVLEEFAQKYKP
ncbi:dehydrogenase/reductase SDR family member 12 isoform X1 [Amphiprion ocellaris]|uniref:Dehydrogenase/reductase (SDR family) member 12 n=2 Tax=Amphiprion ocellaris TaxID=80972 RepID=A0A3Q1DAS3_AMPOC|nr:dehydrogenase/reductase SDR family member 12 isoform X1 [Amphiprion ocellaris]